MRVSREAMAEHHEKIVTAASRMLRRRGIERTSVIDLMKAVGLTHGGFYRHFKSKDALVAESTQEIFQIFAARFKARSEKDGPKAALRAYVDDYLTGQHLNVWEEGCPIAAYGPDAARESLPIREVFGQGINQLVTLVAEGLSCPKEQRRARAAELMSLLTGAIIMARAAGDSKLSREILASARHRADRMIEEKR